MLGVIIPDRGDRPVLMDFCMEQIERQTLQPDKISHIGYTPVDEKFDLTARIKKGMETEVDKVVIWENDDCYHPMYLEYVSGWLDRYDFVGCEVTLYYHIKNKTYMHQKHPGRSSLFCTAFRKDAMKDFRWPSDQYLWLDIKIWEYARDTGKNIFLSQLPINIGLKHGEGLCGGKAHKWVMDKKDSDLSFLKRMTTDWQYEFYSKLKL